MLRRVGREGIEKLERFGSESYSNEELVAEVGAAMLCGVCGIAPATIENSASYLQSRASFRRLGVFEKQNIFRPRRYASSLTHQDPPRTFVS